MKKLGIMTKLRRRWKDRSGQSTTEYILILAIVVMIASKMKGKLQTAVDQGVNNVSGVINDQTDKKNFE